MNIYEKCRAIRRIIVNRAAEVMAYTNWSDQFAAEQIRQIPEELAEQKNGKYYFGIRPAEMTDRQCEELGFVRWDKDKPMRLIPLWLMPFLADEIEAECIDGKRITKKSDMNNDNRLGCLAYGIIPRDANRLVRRIYRKIIKQEGFIMSLGKTVVTCGTICVIAMLGVTGSCTMHRNKMIKEVVLTGVDPVAARLSMDVNFPADRATILVEFNKLCSKNK